GSSRSSPARAGRWPAYCAWSVPLAGCGCGCGCGRGRVLGGQLAEHVLERGRLASQLEHGPTVVDRGPEQRPPQILAARSIDDELGGAVSARPRLAARHPRDGADLLAHRLRGRPLDDDRVAVAALARLQL